MFSSQSLLRSIFSSGNSSSSTSNNTTNNNNHFSHNHHHHQQQQDDRPVFATLTLVSNTTTSTSSTTTTTTTTTTSQQQQQNNQVPKLVKIQTPSFRIGRDPKFSDLTLDAPSCSRMMSRRHCIIQYNFNAKQFLCIDQKSLNGTFVNNERVGSKEIHDGDYLVFTGGSAYAIGEKLPLPSGGGGSSSSGSGNNSFLDSSKMDISLIGGSSNSSSSNENNSSSNSSSGSGSNRDAVQSYVCMMPNTFVYRFNILQHPNESTPTPCKLSLTPKLTTSSDTADGTATTATKATSPVAITNHQHNGQNETSKKRDRSTVAHDIDLHNDIGSDEEDEDDQMQSPLKKTKLNADQENQVLKERLTELEKELRTVKDQNIQIQTMSGHANTVLMSILESEFHCSICQTLLLQPTTLQCSHTFCTSCIQQWLPSHRSCPICRKQITKQPIRNISLQGVLEKLEMLLSEDDKQERVAREAEIKKKEDDDLQKLNALVKNARDKGAQFLKIEDEWSERDKRAFVAGLTKYSGVKARQVYLNLTGFNLESIAKLTGNSLIRVCKNVGVTPVYLTGTIYDNSRRQGQLLDAESTREKLREFCRNDTISIGSD